MSFYNTLVFNELEVGITDGFSFKGHLALDLENEAIVMAIKNRSPHLIEALLRALNTAEQLKSISIFTGFEHDFFLGESTGNWEKALKSHTTHELMEYKKYAEIVLFSDYATEERKQEARIYLNALDGNYPEYIPNEYDLKRKKQEKYNGSRAKWLALLIEDRPYKCQYCAAEKNLKIKHLISIMKGGETKLSNLAFRCVKCINKK